jgi:hypothetical protein
MPRARSRSGGRRSRSPVPEEEASEGGENPPYWAAAEAAALRLGGSTVPVPETLGVGSCFDLEFQQLCLAHCAGRRIHRSTVLFPTGQLDRIEGAFSGGVAGRHFQYSLPPASPISAYRALEIYDHEVEIPHCPTCGEALPSPAEEEEAFAPRVPLPSPPVVLGAPFPSLFRDQDSPAQGSSGASSSSQGPASPPSLWVRRQQARGLALVRAAVVGREIAQIYNRAGIGPETCDLQESRARAEALIREFAYGLHVRPEPPPDSDLPVVEDID